jgi:hypothetical protein
VAKTQRRLRASAAKVGTHGPLGSRSLAKSSVLRLHLTSRGLELPGIIAVLAQGETTMFRNVMLATLVAVATLSAGCSTCRQTMCGWFNRGDRCNVAPPVDCAPGMPRATMMLPGTPQVLPGPIEIAPQP